MVGVSVLVTRRKNLTELRGNGDHYSLRLPVQAIFFGVFYFFCWFLLYGHTDKLVIIRCHPWTFPPNKIFFHFFCNVSLFLPFVKGTQMIVPFKNAGRHRALRRALLQESIQPGRRL